MKSPRIYIIWNEGINREKEKSKQPLEYPSAGSTFKRPEGYFAAKLIEESGLKGEKCRRCRSISKALRIYNK